MATRPSRFGFSLKLRQLPKSITVSPTAARNIGELIRKDIIEGVKGERKLDNSPQKKNDPDTLREKARRNLGSRSLIGEDGSFIDPATYRIQVHSRGVRISLIPRVAKIANHLAAKGYTNFLGISVRVRRKVTGIWARDLRDQLRRAPLKR